MDKPRVSDNKMRTYVALAQTKLVMGEPLTTLDLFALDLHDDRRRIAKLEADAEQLVSQTIPKHEFIRWALDWRDIPEDQACKRCGGRGSIAYGNTATWRFGIGGSMMTSDVCNLCWGSGNQHRPWTDLRKMQPIAAQRQKERE